MSLKLYNFYHLFLEVSRHYLIFGAKSHRHYVDISHFSILNVSSSVPVAAKIILSLMGKLAIAAAFHLLFLYTAELFTTQQRSLALGHSSFCGRIGSMISPYLNDLLVRQTCSDVCTSFAS